MEVVVRDLEVARDGRRVLAIPSLAIASGRVTVVLGPNGAGKSTLLRTIAGLDRAGRGGVSVGGRGAGEDPRAIAYAFQQPVFLQGTVRANLALGPELRGVPASEVAARVDDAARACGVEHLLGRSARRLSGGEAGRVNVARALALQAPVTLLDEPLAAFDAAGRRRFLDDLPRLLARFTKTAVLVTHDREEALRIADDLVVLAEGAVVAGGPKRKVFEEPGSVTAARLLGYLVVGIDGAAIGIPPGALRVGGEGTPFTMSVESVVDAVTHREAIGRIGDAPASLVLPDGADASPGSTLNVVAARTVRL